MNILSSGFFMKLLKVGVFLLFFSSVFCGAQNNNVQDANAKAPVVTIKQKKTDTIVKNLFKWDYSLLSRGILLLNYERRLSENLAIELGLGGTYSDFIFSTYYVNEHVSKSVTIPDTNYPGYWTITHNLLENPFANSTKKLGFAVDLSQRFYLKKACFEGFYLSLYLSYRKYNYSLSVVDSNSFGWPTTNTSILFNNLYYSFFDAGEKLGYQGHFKSNHFIYYDFYIGLSYRRALLNTLQVRYKNVNSLYYISSETVTYSEYLQKLNLVQVMLGAKIGFGRLKK